MKFCYFLQLLFLINVTVVALNSLPSKESSERGRGRGWKGALSVYVDTSSLMELIELMLNAVLSTF